MFYFWLLRFSLTAVLIFEIWQHRDLDLNHKNDVITVAMVTTTFQYGRHFTFWHILLIYSMNKFKKNSVDPKNI
jgi:hypothetical protein